MKRPRSSSSDSDSLFIPHRIVKKPYMAVSPRSPLISPATTLRPFLDSHKRKQRATRIVQEIPDDGPPDDADLEACLAVARKARIVIDLTGDSEGEAQSREDEFWVYNIRRCSRTEVDHATGGADKTSSIKSVGGFDRDEAAEDVHDVVEEFKQDPMQEQIVINLTGDTDDNEAERMSSIESGAGGVAHDEVAQDVHDVSDVVSQHAEEEFKQEMLENRDVAIIFAQPVWSPLPGCRREIRAEKATDGSVRFFSLTPNSLAPRKGVMDEGPVSPKSFPVGLRRVLVGRGR